MRDLANYSVGKQVNHLRDRMSSGSQREGEGEELKICIRSRNTHTKFVTLYHPCQPKTMREKESEKQERERERLLNSAPKPAVAKRLTLSTPACFHR